MSLPGCTRTVTKFEYGIPPKEYLQDCDKPNPVLTDNASLARGYADRGGAIDRCNADKAALRAWAGKLGK